MDPTNVERSAERLPRANSVGLLQFCTATPTRTNLSVFVALYAASMVVLLVFASGRLLSDHTPYNHFAHLARGWLDGRLDLGGPPPAYAHNNDFAKFEDKWFVAFPPFPAFLLLPLVAIAGEPEAVRDGQFFLWFAGLVPGLSFLALQRLSAAGLSGRGTWSNAAFGLLAAFGTVFFFSAEQGTVWFAAHVVAACLAAGYLYFSVGARFPVLAGLCLGLGALTRPPLLFGVALFACEVLRVNSRADAGAPSAGLRVWVGSVAWPRVIKSLLAFALPLLAAVLFTLWYNSARFGDPFENGYRYLTVAWQARMEKWGLFHYHYLSRNLGVALSMLPWMGEGGAPFRINVHGLALWFTTPLYLFVLWPRLRAGTEQAARDIRWLHWGLWLTVAAVAVPTLFYQNTGWAQFGYRFSNDYFVFLFALLALGGRRLGTLFWLAAAWSVLVNAFGAWTFGRADYKEYYYVDPSQTKFYERD